MAEPDAEARRSSASSTARTAGRGGLALSAAKLYFLVLGLAQQILLSWLLKDGYGALRGALSPASITYNPLVTGGVQGLSRIVSQAEPEQRPHAIRLGLMIHAAVAAVFALGFSLGAPFLGDALNSDYLVPSFRVLGLVVLFYGLYAPLVGVLNGLRRFGAQAVVDATAATLRTAALFLGAWLMLDQGSARAVLGACWGFTAVAALMVLIGVALLGLANLGLRGSQSVSGPETPQERAKLKVREHLSFIGPVVVAQYVLNLLLQADTNTLRGFATRAAENAGLEVTAADPLVGAYNAGQLFAFLPYQLLMGITFILFPMLAAAHAKRDQRAVRQYVLEGTRIAVIFVGLIVTVSASLSDSLLRLIFPAQFAELGAGSMQVLTLGLSAFALFGVFSTVLNSIGKQWYFFAVALFALGLVLGFNLLWVSGTPFGPALLVNTALATSAGVCVATLAAGVLVWRFVGAAVSVTLLLRVSVCLAAILLLARQLPPLGKLQTVLMSGAIGIAYVVALLATRVLGPSDWRKVRQVIGR